MIQITPDIAIDENELDESFVRSSGPGGQNVNKVATAVQLRFNVASSPNLPEDVRERLIRLAGNRMTGDGVLLIDARRFRSQERNREDAVERLKGMIQQAAEKPKPRKKFKPGRKAKMQRLEEKRKRGKVKQLRRPVRRSEY